MAKPSEQEQKNDVAVIHSLADLEAQILTWQETCLRKFRPLDGEIYLIRLLPVQLANGKPLLRYGQHWVGAQDRRPLICPNQTDAAVLAEKRECPLCLALGDKHDDRQVSLSWLFYCFVLADGGEAITGDRRFRLHQWWMTDRVCGILLDLAKHGSIFGWGMAHNLEVTCDEKCVSVELARQTDLATPDAVIQRVMAAVVSPKRRVHWQDLQYEALGCGFIGADPEHGERDY